MNHNIIETQMNVVNGDYHELIISEGYSFQINYFMLNFNF